MYPDKAQPPLGFLSACWLVIASFKSNTLRKLSDFKSKINLFENGGKLLYKSQEGQTAIDENAVFFDLAILIEHYSLLGSISFPLRVSANLKLHPCPQNEDSVTVDITRTHTKR